jgi:hypothetical protein
MFLRTASTLGRHAAVTLIHDGSLLETRCERIISIGENALQERWQL